MYERFTDRARNVMKLANEEANNLDHEYIGTEHILLGLIRQPQGVAAVVLKNLNIDFDKVRRDTLQVIQRGSGSKKKSWWTSFPTTPRANKVVELAVETARDFKHNYVGSEHLLMGLLREQEGVAGQVLKNLGLSAEIVGRQILDVLGMEMQDVPAQPAEPVSAAKMPVVPGPVEAAIHELVQYCRTLREQKEQAVAAQDFQKAAELRDHAEKLIQFLTDAFRTGKN